MIRVWAVIVNTQCITIVCSAYCSGCEWCGGIVSGPTSKWVSLVGTSSEEIQILQCNFQFNFKLDQGATFVFFALSRYHVWSKLEFLQRLHFARFSFIKGCRGQILFLNKLISLSSNLGTLKERFFILPISFIVIRVVT